MAETITDRFKSILRRIEEEETRVKPLEERIRELARDVAEGHRRIAGLYDKLIEAGAEGLAEILDDDSTYTRELPGLDTLSAGDRRAITKLYKGGKAPRGVIRQHTPTEISEKKGIPESVVVSYLESRGIYDPDRVLDRTEPERTSIRVVEPTSRDYESIDRERPEEDYDRGKITGIKIAISRAYKGSAGHGNPGAPCTDVPEIQARLALRGRPVSKSFIESYIAEKYGEGNPPSETSVEPVELQDLSPRQIKIICKRAGKESSNGFLTEMALRRAAHGIAPVDSVREHLRSDYTIVKVPTLEPGQAGSVAQQYRHGNTKPHEIAIRAGVDEDQVRAYFEERLGTELLFGPLPDP